MTESNPKGSRLTRVLVWVAVADVLVALGLGWYVRHKPQPLPQLPPAAVQQANAPQLGDALRYVTLASEPLVTKDGVDLRIANAQDSRFSVVVELIDLQNKATLSTTGRIEPGYYLETLALEPMPQPGQTLCLARLYVYSVETGEFLGTVAKQVLLNVK